MCSRFDPDTMPDPMLLIATPPTDEAEEAQPGESAADKKQVRHPTCSGVLAECSGGRWVVCSNGHKHTTLQLLWQRKIPKQLVNEFT